MFFTQTKVICRFEDRKLDVNDGKINGEWCFFFGGGAVIFVVIQNLR